MATNTSNFNFQGIGTVSDSTIEGCTDPIALNYDPLATTDDGSCIAVVNGCMDSSACNYDSTANQDDGSCEYCSCGTPIVGCKDPTACNYNPFADCDDGTCTGLSGCTNSLYAEYNALNPATCDDGSCYGLLGCTNPAASNYDPLAIVNDGSCVACVYGCTNPADFNYDASANCDDGSCIASVYGCTDSSATTATYNPNANVDDGSCLYEVYGCTDSSASNWYGNVPANTTLIDDGSCEYLGCIDSLACNYDPYANVDDGSCVLPAGCDDDSYLEYDPLITYCPDNANACITLIVNGCMDCGTIWEGQNLGQFCDGVSAASSLGATNYNPLANVNSGCTYPTLGCMDPLACNYNGTATVSDGSCTYAATLFGANTDCNGDCLTGFVDVNGSCVSIVLGCTDPLACNYNASANVDDGSCNTVYGCMDCGTVWESNLGTVANPSNTTCLAETGTAATGPGAINYDPSATCNDGCIVCSTATISVDITNIAQNTGTGGQATPANGSAEITPSTNAEDTPYTYTFSDSVGNTIFNTSASGTTTTISGLNAETYTVNITTAHGCTSTSSFAITNNITQYVLGCTNSSACNYNSAATYNDGSCLFGASGCTDCGTLWETGVGVPSNYVGATGTGSCQQITGTAATGLGATNYTPGATCDDGSCNYGCPAQIGDTYHTGIVFWVSDPADPNCTGYIAATGDTRCDAIWGCSGTSISGADGTAIGTGYQNSVDIVAGCAPPYATSADIPAAAPFFIYSNYSIGGYSDWFLPSGAELNEMFLQLYGPNNVYDGIHPSNTNPANFTDGIYWSSTEMSSTHAAFTNFGTSSIIDWDNTTHLGNHKSQTRCVRPIRKFYAADPCIGATSSYHSVIFATWGIVC